ncbi:hypothetical protein L873DRAFT_1762955 [Choiromyces venosus 120613-1]|uniref:Phospholipid/glycerol acyltransferase domain-containing protein n=1 Tax=Choiromyces venosus 120613-1 TaxID=1336337 RepID=A0A3N4JZ28_9PEZI|nr:hypothetical protein L873DRAFT_1762955 [Choiromyces venosus 120613-1]
MEKFSQFRDRGTQIAPFLPITPPRTTLQTLTGLLLFLLRLPLFLSLLLPYLLILQHLPIPALLVLRKAILWSVLLTSGIWWIDLQVENVKKGSLSRQPKSKLPTPGSVLICTCTSPLDVLYLSAIFDPVFTVSAAGRRRVREVGVWGAIMAAFAPPSITPPPAAGGGTAGGGDEEITLAELCKKYGDTRIIAVFPEATTTNGRGVLRFAPCLDTLPATVEIFPVSLRYSPADVTTPIPETYGYTLFALLSRPTHCIRVRIGEVLRNDDDPLIPTKEEEEEEESSDSDTATDEFARGGGGGAGEKKEDLTKMDKQSRLSERGAEALARIARSKRVNLGVREKIAFVEAWGRNKRSSRF